MNAAAFLDRDGVLNELVPRNGRAPEGPVRPVDVTVVPGAPEAIRVLRSAGLVPIIVSNQPGAAKGECSLADLHATHARVLELLTQHGAPVDASFLCLHGPGECACRKPAPGLLLRAAREYCVDLGRSVVFGDADTDVAAGRAAGCRTVLIRNPMSAHRRGSDLHTSLVADDLRSAVLALGYG